MPDFKFALRQLLKHPGFTAVTVLTLALGIGANSAIFSLIYGVLLKPLPYPEPERLVTLWERNAQRGMEQELVSGPNYLDWRERAQSFSGITSYGDFELEMSLAGKGEPETRNQDEGAPGER